MNMDELAEEKCQPPPPPSSLQQELNIALKNNQMNQVQKSYLGHQRQSSDTQVTLKTSHTSAISSSGYGSSSNPTPARSEDTLVCEGILSVIFFIEAFLLLLFSVLLHYSLSALSSPF